MLFKIIILIFKISSKSQCKLTENVTFGWLPLVALFTEYAEFTDPATEPFDGDILWDTLPPTIWSLEACRFSIFANMVTFYVGFYTIGWS